MCRSARVCWGVGILLAAIALGAGFSGCGKSSERHNVLLITIDTTRADYIGCYGLSDVKTPAIDGLAAQGVRFARNVSTSQCTNPSHSSILTGLYLARHQVYDNRTPLSDKALTLSEIFKNQGYATLGAVSARHLKPSNSGFGQGFDTFLATDQPSIPASVRNQDYLAELEKLARDDFFSWVHYFDPHGDYAPPAPYDTMYEPGDDHDPVPSRKSMESKVAKSQDLVDPDEIIPLYKGEISFLDFEIGRLLATLEKMGVADRTLVVLIADHGESMAEKEIYFCHAGMYNQVLHVPLIMRLPGRLPEGHVVESMTSSTDVFPTILELVGLGGNLPVLSGRTLVPTFEDPQWKVHDFVFSEAVRGVIRAVYSEDRKFIKPYPKDWAMPHKAMFAMWEDYWETENLLETEPEKARLLEDILDKWVESTSQKALPSVDDYELDEKTRQALESLGY